MKTQLTDLRHALLLLHKTLVDSERRCYEQSHGAIRSPGDFLRLLTEDPWFAWLRPLSQLIVAMDEALDEKEPLTPATVSALMGEARGLLVAREGVDGFPGRYFEALQRDPAVVLAHAGAVKHLGASGPDTAP